MEKLDAEAFLGDKVYDTGALINMLEAADITTVIPPVKSRESKERTFVNCIRAACHFDKVFRAHYAKLAASFI
ncbi:hypothetical protein, partial [Treponema endosymbiont of Eucomonympha sp.]